MVHERGNIWAVYIRCSAVLYINTLFLTLSHDHYPRKKNGRFADIVQQEAPISNSIVTMTHISCITSDKQRDICRKPHFFIPPAFDDPVGVVPVGVLSCGLVQKN